MSKYTVMIKNIVESKSGLDFLDPLNRPGYTEAIAAARQKIFDFQYPIFAESYREVLETKILKHFYFREIAFETYGQWKLYLDDKLNNIMPYYNKLYNTDGLDYDPFTDTDYTIEHGGEGTRDGTYDKTEKVVHDGDTSLNTAIETSNTKKTDNKETSTMSETLKNTHDDSTDTTSHETLTKGTHVTKQNTGTQHTEGENTSKDSGTDTIEESGTSTTENNNDHWNLYSDTPQGAIDNFKNPGYYSNIRNETDDGSSSGTTTGKTETEYGKQTKDTGNTTRTDNLTEQITNTGTDSTENIIGTENQGKYTNETTGNTSSNLDGTVTDTGEQTNTQTGKNNFTDDKTGKNTEKIVTTDDFIRHIYGKRGTQSYSELLLKYRETLINIDMMILEELEDLFFQLW